VPASHRKWRLQGQLDPDGRSCPITVDIRAILLIIFRKYETPTTPDRAFGPTKVTSGIGVITVRILIAGVVA
jgi:hypothetical protein